MNKVAPEAIQTSCPYCGQENQERAAVCPGCGTVLAEAPSQPQGHGEIVVGFGVLGIQT